MGCNNVDIYMWGISKINYINMNNNHYNVFVNFSYIQDTVVSLHALARFSSLLRQSSLDAEVKVKTDFKEKTVHVNRKNRLHVQRIEVRSSVNLGNINNKLIYIFIIL